MSLPLSIDRLVSVFEKAPSLTVTVFGDYCLDKYLYIDSSLDEPSIETGLTAYQVVSKGIFPGGAGTVVNNLLALGVKVKCVGVLGDDGEGYELRRELAGRGADTSLMVVASDRCTSTYTKPMRGNNLEYAEINRLDFRNFSPMSHVTEAELIANLTSTSQSSDGLIVLDQFNEPELGTVNQHMRDVVGNLALDYPEMVVYSDSRAFIRHFTNSIVKCNELELYKAVNDEGSIPADADPPSRDQILQWSRMLNRRNGRPVFTSLGAHGMAVCSEDVSEIVPGVTVNGPIDICGAGDAASSGIVLGLCAGLECKEAAYLGNIVASITIQQLGVTGTASPKQVLDRLEALVQGGAEVAF